MSEHCAVLLVAFPCLSLRVAEPEALGTLPERG
jgi:hypothetical protein